MASWTRRTFRALVTVVVLLVLFVGSTLWAPAANAAFEGCRADPIVYLSDGSILIVTVDVGTDASNLSLLDYSIHAPRGVTMLGVDHDNPPGFVGEVRFSFDNDAKPNQIMTDTVVQVQSGKKIPVTATTERGGTSVSVSGVNGQHLKATLAFRP